jgi:hypothetical protein
LDITGPIGLSHLRKKRAKSIIQSKMHACKACNVQTKYEGSDYKSQREKKRRKKREQGETPGGKSIHRRGLGSNTPTKTNIR